MKKFLLGLTGAGALATPFLAFADTDAFTLLGTIMTFINKLIPVLIAIMVLLLLISIVMYATSSDEEKQEKARKTMINVIIGLVVFIALWGIVRLILNTLDLDNTDPTAGDFPCFETELTVGVDDCP